MHTKRACCNRERKDWDGWDSDKFRGIMKKRETHLDAICGVMILWMILGHIFQATHLTESSVYLTLYRILFFFMPWFCFKAGMFEKTMPDKVCFEKNFKRLMIP